MDVESKLGRTRRRRRQTPILTAFLLATSAMQMLVVLPPAWSQPAPAATRNYAIPAGSLAQALNRFADISQLQLVSSGEITRGLHSNGLNGAYAPQQALAQLLAGSGLSYRFTSRTSVTIERPGAANGAAASVAGAINLDTIDVQGAGNPNSTMTPMPAYAGGQVATGGQVGLLGNRSVMDTPFNQTSYTAKTIQDQQAHTLADVLDNDASVRRLTPGSGGLGDFTVRGFPLYSSDIGLNGLYGLAPGNLISTDFVERVEVLKGPSALLNGMPPGGSIGGSINLVTKRAGAEPLTRFTTGYVSRGQFGEHVDIARRFGADNACGARFNGTFTDGKTAVDNTSNQIGLATLGLDCRTDRLRVSADFGYQKNDTHGATRFVTFDPGVPVLRAPAADKLFTPSWAFFNNEDKFGMMNAEYDLAPNVTAYGAFGLHDYQQKTLVATFPDIFDTAGNYASAPRYSAAEAKALAGQFGVRATTDTGPVNHALNLNGAVLDSTYYQSPFVQGAGFTSNIYNPVFVPYQDIAQPGVSKSSNQKLTSFGVADTLSVLDKRVQLTLGVRHQEVSSDSFDMRSGAVTSGYDKSAWTPSYAIVVKPLENVSLYANYIEGLQQGSIVGAGFSNEGQVLPPFVSKQVETGIKVDWGTITTTISAFQIQQPNLITVAGTPLPTQSLNGEQRNRGMEANAFGELTPGLRLLGGVMLIDGRQTRTDGGVNDGKKAPGVPDFQLNVGAEWDAPFVKGLTLKARAIYTASQYFDADNTQVMPSWTRYDVGLRYKTKAWNTPLTVRFDVQNVFNKNYWETNYYAYTALGAPRTYLLSITADF